MLLPENEPFATAHRENLGDVIDLLKKLRHEVPTVSDDELKMAISKLEMAQRGFDRYKVCFADEVAQKNRMRDRWMNESPSSPLNRPRP